MKGKLLLALPTLLLLLLASAGLSAQDANQVAADKAWATGDPSVGEAARTITVTVNDADINLPGPFLDIGPDRFGQAFTIPAGSTVGDSISFFVDSFPIADRNGDGSVNSLDVDLVVPGTGFAVDIDGDGDTDLAVQAVGADDGAISIRVVDNDNGAAFGSAVLFQLNYDAVVVNDTTDAAGAQPVVVASNQDVTGFGLRLRETNRTSGLYSATFEISTDPTRTDFASFDETGLGVDLNGDGDAVDTAVGVGLYEAIYGGADLSGDAAIVVTAGTVDETVTATDVNGDGDALDVAVSATVLYEAAYGVDLNGDGDALDQVTSYPANLFPEGTVRPIIQVSGAANDQVIVTYSDLNSALARTGARSTHTIDIESLAPGFSGLSPFTGASTTSVVPKIQADVIDTGSGVVEASIAIEVYAWVDFNGDGKVKGGDVGAAIAGSPFDLDDSDDNDGVTSTAIASGFRVQVRLPAQPPNIDLAWQVVARDAAGNPGGTDVDHADNNVTLSALSIDNLEPVMNEAFTGYTWDEDAAEINVYANSRTTVRVRFDERLDATSVIPSDFRVGVAIPTGADVFGSNVFLTVSALDPSAGPLVELVGAVHDHAGNILDAGPEVTASDCIAPGLEISLDRPPESTQGRITVRTDENIVGSPAVRLQGFILVGTTQTAPRMWERVFDPELYGGPEAEFTVVVEVYDARANRGFAELTTKLTQGLLNMTVVLQGESEHDGAIVTINGPESYVVTTDASGMFTGSLAPGTYTVKAEYIYHVPAVATVVVEEGRPTTVQTMLWGATSTVAAL
jgi:hypothetical protein